MWVRMLDTLRFLNLWQKVVLVVVTLGVAGGVYGIYHWAVGPGESTRPDDVQLVQVQHGSIVNSVSAGGSLVFPEKEQLTFGSAGTVGEVNVQEGDAVEEGYLLAKLDDTSMIPLQKAVVQAEINLAKAEEDLDEAQSPYTELDIAQADAAVANARVTLVAAQEALEKAENPYTESDITEAELAIINAQIALDGAEYNFEMAEERYLSNTSVTQWAQDYEKKKRELTIAELNLAEAEEALAEMLAGANPLEVEQKQKQLAVAEVNLNKVEDDLAEILGSVDSLEVELKQLEVAGAQAALDEATELLERATMVAPFGGIITLVNIEAGESVNANQVVIELMDPSVVEVSAFLDEIDVSLVRPGQRVSVYLDALPDLTPSGEVSSISPIAMTQAGVVKYPITVEVIVPEGIQLLEKMSATVTIVVEEVNNVLLIPNQAIWGSFDRPMVNVMVNDEIEERAVVLGISDGLWTEVIAGLQETDNVVVEVSATSSGLQQSFSKGIMPGAGFMGGGFRK